MKFEFAVDLLNRVDFDLARDFFFVEITGKIKLIYEEKNKMRMEEMKMNKLAKILRSQESQIDMEKKILQKRKDCTLL